MIEIYVHFKLESEFMHPDVCYKTMVHSVPRIGESFHTKDTSKLGERLSEGRCLDKNIDLSEWTYNGKVSFDDAVRVSDVLYKDEDKTIHIELSK